MGDEKSYDLMIMCVAVACALLAIWYFGSPYLQHYSLYLTMGQLWVLEQVGQYVDFLNVNALATARYEIKYSLIAGIGNYNADALMKYRSFPQSIFAGIILVPFIIVALRHVFKRGPSFYGMLDLDILDIRLSILYYPGRPVVGRQMHLRNPIEEKAGRYAYKPWEFVYKWEICKRIVKGGSEAIPLTYKPKSVLLEKPSAADRSRIYFDNERATEVFAKQLGRRLNSADDILRCPQEVRLMALICLTEIDPMFADETRKTQAWLKQAATSFWNITLLLKRASPEKLPPLKRETLDMSGVDEALKTALTFERSREALESSAYVNSLMVLLMGKTRLKSSDFRWLKFVNRPMWYAMNSVGNAGRVFVEARGSAGHALYEEKMGSRQVVPYLESAVLSLKEEVTKFKWTG